MPTSTPMTAASRAACRRFGKQLAGLRGESEAPLTATSEEEELEDYASLEHRTEAFLVISTALHKAIPSAAAETKAFKAALRELRSIMIRNGPHGNPTSIVGPLEQVLGIAGSLEIVCPAK